MAGKLYDKIRPFSLIKNSLGGLAGVPCVGKIVTMLPASSASHIPSQSVSVSSMPSNYSLVAPVGKPLAIQDANSGLHSDNKQNGNGHRADPSRIPEYVPSALSRFVYSMFGVVFLMDWERRYYSYRKMKLTHKEMLLKFLPFAYSLMCAKYYAFTGAVESFLENSRFVRMANYAALWSVELIESIWIYAANQLRLEISFPPNQPYVEVSPRTLFRLHLFRLVYFQCILLGDIKNYVSNHSVLSFPGDLVKFASFLWQRLVATLGRKNYSGTTTDEDEYSNFMRVGEAMANLLFFRPLTTNDFYLIEPREQQSDEQKNDSHNVEEMVENYGEDEEHKEPVLEGEGEEEGTPDDL